MRPTAEDKEALNILIMSRSNDLSEWEESFLSALEELAEAGRFWTVKQGANFDEVWAQHMEPQL
jgi:hypothetical protein